MARPTPTTAAAPTQTPAVDIQESAGATVTIEYENQEDLQSLLASNDVTSDIVFWSVQVLLLDGSSVIVRTGHLYLETHEDVRFDSNLGSAHLIRAQTRDGITLWAVTEQITADTVLKIDLRSTYEAVLIYASLGSMTPDSASINDLKRKATQALDQDADGQVQALKRLVDGAILEKVDYTAVTVGAALGPVRSLDDVLASPETDATTEATTVPTSTPTPTHVPTEATPTATTDAGATQTPAVDAQESAGATVTIEYDNQEDLQSLLASNDLASDIVIWSVQVLLLDGSSVIVRTGHLYLETHEDVRFDSNLGNAHLIMARTRDGITLWALTELITGDTVLKIDLRSTYEAVLIYASSGSMTPDSALINDLKRKAAQALERDADG